MFGECLIENSQNSRVEKLTIQCFRVYQLEGCGILKILPKHRISHQNWQMLFYGN